MLLPVGDHIFKHQLTLSLQLFDELASIKLRIKVCDIVLDKQFYQVKRVGQEQSFELLTLRLLLQKDVRVLIWINLCHLLGLFVIYDLLNN